MRVDGEGSCKSVTGNCKALRGVRAKAFLGWRLPIFISFLLDLSNIENGRGL